MDNYYNKHKESVRLKEFPALSDVTYLDHAGTTLVSRSQLEAHYKDLSSNIYGNPHSRSPSSQLTADTIDQVRYRVLQFFNTSPDDYTVIFTSGCTGALKLVAECFDFYGYTCSSCHSNSVQNGEAAEVKGTSKIGSGLSEREEDKDNSCRRGSFIYLLDNHTSVQGMRELAFSRAGRVRCVDCDKDNVISKEHVLYQSEVYKNGGNSLFAYPAQSNFSGQKYPMEWISSVQNGRLGRMTLDGGRCCVLLDAACLVSTSPLDLGCYKPDFVTLSFYKIFGYPTGLGALLIRNESSHLLKKTYFGGGTVSVSLSSQRFHVLRPSLAERFEDGTVSFLDILSLRHGFQTLETLAGGISAISDHIFKVASYFFTSLKSLHHSNGGPLAVIYCHSNFEDQSQQGAIVTFNLRRANGDYTGFSEVDKLGQLHNIHVRTGCFCNLGACQKFLGISDEELKVNFDAGHVCGDDKDLIDGKPTGAIRVSFGYMSTFQDANNCLQFLVDCFLETSQKPVFFVKSQEKQSRENVLDQSLNCNPSNAAVKQSVSSSVTYTDSLTHSVISGVSKLDTERKPASVHSKIPIPNKTPSGTLEDRSNDNISTSIDESMSTHLFVEPTSADNINKVRDSERRLTDIFLYPVKSCAAFRVDKWQVSSRGLLYDREWMIVADSGVTLGQKREPRLCLLQPTIDLDLQLLVLNYPRMKPVTVPLFYEESAVQETSLCNSKVCGDRVKSIDCGQEVSDWLSEVLDRPGTRLIRQKADNIRKSKLKQTDSGDSSSQLSLANESQYLLLCRSSVDVLRDKIKERCEAGESSEPIDSQDLLHRFRGNLVLSGGDPFEEESWKSLQIGNISFKSQGSCTRCQMVCIDQVTGERSKEPLKTLAVWRERKSSFGIYLCCNEDFRAGIKTLHVGDHLTVS